MISVQCQNLLAQTEKKYERFLLVRGEFFHQPMLTNHVAEFLFSLRVARIKSPSGKYCRLNLPGDGRRKSKIFQNLPMVSNFHLLHKHCQNDHIVASMSWANEKLKLLRNIVSHCGQTTKRFVHDIVSYQCFVMSPSVNKHGVMDRKHNVYATMFPEVNKQVNIDRKHNVSATTFPEMDKQGNIDRKHNVSATMFPEVDRIGNIDRKHNVGDRNRKIMFLHNVSRGGQTRKH